MTFQDMPQGHDLDPKEAMTNQNTRTWMWRRWCALEPDSISTFSQTLRMKDS